MWNWISFIINIGTFIWIRCLSSHKRIKMFISTINISFIINIKLLYWFFLKMKLTGFIDICYISIIFKFSIIISVRFKSVQAANSLNVRKDGWDVRRNYWYFCIDWWLWRLWKFWHVIWALVSGRLQPSVKICEKKYMCLSNHGSKIHFRC